MKTGFPLLLAFFLYTALHGGETAAPSACAWPVTLPEITRDTPVYLPLPPEVHARIGGATAELTIRDGQGFLLPMRLRPAETTVTREVTETRTLTTVIKEAETLADGSLRVLCQIDKNAADTFRRIQIATSSKDFSQQVVVEAGDGQQWSPLGEAVLVDLSRYLKFNRTEIVLPQPTATTWLRFTFRTPEKNTENDYGRIVTRLQGGSEVERQVTSEQTRQRFRVDAITCSADKLCQKIEPVAVIRQQPATIDRQELPGKTRLTIPCKWGATALVVATPLKNFARSCRVKADQFEAEAMLQVIDLPGSSPAAVLTIPLPARCQTAIIEIENGGAQPLPITGITLQEQVLDLQFIGRPGNSFLLAFDPAAERNITGTEERVLEATLRENFRTATGRIEGQLGTIRDLPAGGPSPRWINAHRLLMLGISVMCAFLGWILYRASGKITPSTNA